MEFKEGPYNALRKLFPQVDSRIIKATVLDLGDDLQSAIDFLVDEVIGCDLGGCNLDASPSNYGLNNTKELTEVDYNENEEAIVWLSGIGTEPVNVIGLSSSSDGSAVGMLHPDKVERIPPFYTVKDSSNMLLNEEVCSPTSKHGNPISQAYAACMGEEHEIGGMSDGTFLPPVNMSSSPLEDFSSPSVPVVNQGFGMNPNDSQLDSTILSEKVHSQEETNLETKAQVNEHFNSAFCSGPLYESDVPLSTNCEDGTTWGTISSSSNYNVNIEGLDEFIQEARGGKELLKSAIEDVTALWRKTHEAEVETQQAKIDVAKGGLDIMKKADEMRQLLVQAQAANEVHAGEVYGEKAVMATEARELWSRLSQLKAEKSKALAVLNEIQANLEARYKLAVLERQAANEERERKEASAQNVLAVEERLMAKVAQESRDLEEEAQKCTKLREFLIDQGQTVDSLQGEMAVLCEDVEILQKQIEEGVLSMSSGYLSMCNIPLQVSLEGNECAGSSPVSDSRSLKSVSSRCSGCHGSNGSGNGHSNSEFNNCMENIISDRMLLLESANMGDQCVEESVLVMEYISSDSNDASNNSCNGHMEAFPVHIGPYDLNKENLNMFRSRNLSNKESRSDDDGWHVLET